MFGNVNVDYQPCKTAVQLQKATDYMLGRLPEQIRDGVVKTAPNLYWGMGCDRDNYARDVLMTRNLFGKRPNGKNNLAFKMSISFSPDDNDKLTYDEVFRIAKEFADKYFQGYEVLFAVHTDKPHKHVHFLIGNCHIETGRAYRRNQRNLYDMCEFFGEQCMKRGLVNSVRKDYFNDNPDRDKETFAEKQMKAKGKETFKDELREVIRIECADPNNRTLEDVVNALMKHYHVECRVKGNTISYRHPEYTDKNGKLVSVRGSKLGDKYTVKGIEHELEKTRRGRTDRDLAGTAVITETRRESDNNGTNGLAGDQEKIPRTDSRSAGRIQTADRTEAVSAALTGEAQEGGKSLLHTGDASQRCTADQKSEPTKITQAGGNSSGKQESDSHSGAGRNRDMGNGTDGGDSGDLGRCQEGREGHAHGNVGDKDVPSLEELFRSYDRRNGKARRKGASEPEHTEPVRKKRKGIDR